MIERLPMYHSEKDNAHYSGLGTSCITWSPLPPVAMELVLERPSVKKSDRISPERRQRRERVKDNDIVIPADLLEELSNLPPTPVSFNINQVRTITKLVSV